MSRIVRIVAYGRGSQKRVDEASLAEQTAKEAAESADWVASVGAYDVGATAFGETVMGECALAVADPQGNVVVWIKTENLASTSDSKIARACLPWAADIFDRRIKNPTRLASAWSGIQAAFHKVISPLELLAISGD